MTDTRTTRFQIYALWALPLMILFPLIYGLTNHLAVTSGRLYQFGFPFESQIPFIPSALVIYFSLQILFLLPVFLLDSGQINRLGQSLTLALVVAGIIFYLFPAPTLYFRELPEGFWRIPYQSLYSVDQNYNTFPSLHICFTFLLVQFLNLQSKQAWIYWLWFFLICLSVLLTHQHHLMDIFGGISLGELIWRLRRPEVAKPA